MKTFAIISFCCTILLSCRSIPVTTTDDENSQTQDLSQAFEFALIGDTPYGVSPGEKMTLFDDLVDEINSDQNLKWVLHAGDIKSGKSICSDEIYSDRLTRFNTFEMPLIYTPGDNEWTDCHRKKAGAYQPLERLKKLRQVFYPKPGFSLGNRTMKLETQANTPEFVDYPENVRWVENNIVFFTIHLVGSQNGEQAFGSSSLVKRDNKNDEEVRLRTQAALHWLKSGFEVADKLNSPGVFIMIHANPGFNGGELAQTGFKSFLEALEKAVRAFSKPVLFAHGDTHQYRYDKPSIITDEPPPNFSRVENYGPYQTGWVRINVNPQSKKVFDVIEEVM